MRLNDKALTIATGLVLFLGVGTFVHKGDEMFGSKGAETQVAKAEITSPSTTDAMPDTENTATASPDIPDLILARNEQTSATTVQDTFGTVQIDPVPLDCSLSLSAVPLRGARVQLEVLAPCHKNKVVTITHAGLRFTEILNDKGMITVTIPVLSDPANIEVFFADGVSKSISAPIKGLSSMQRTGIAWSGQADLQLHASENSFNTSQNQQITQLNTRTYKQSYLQGGGYLTTLGNAGVENGKFVQIYSIENPKEIFVDFEIVLNDPSSRCGENFSVNTVRYVDELGIQLSNKNVSVRNCSAENETIVLKNLLRNMIVAQRN